MHTPHTPHTSHTPDTPDSHPPIEYTVVDTAIDVFTASHLNHTSLDEEALDYLPPVASPVRFTSTKVPNRKEVANNCKLPFGCLLMPAAVLSPAPPCLRRPVARCVGCGGCINMYCGFNFHTGVWNCVFCGRHNDNKEEYADPSATLALYPELTQPVVEYLDPSQQLFGIDYNTYYVFLIDLTLPKKDLEVCHSTVPLNCT